MGSRKIALRMGGGEYIDKERINYRFENANKYIIIIMQADIEDWRLRLKELIGNLHYLFRRTLDSAPLRTDM